MTSLPNLTEIDALADGDYFYVWDASDPSSPDKKVPVSKVRPAGAKITNYIRYASTIVIPNLAALAEADVLITVTGAQVGDHVDFNLSAAPPANIGIQAVWAAADQVGVRFRNTHASNAFVTASPACTALVTRSV